MATYMVTGDGYLWHGTKHGECKFYARGEQITVPEDFVPSANFIPIDEEAHAVCALAIEGFLPPLARGERDLTPDGKRDEVKQGRRQIEQVKRRNWARSPEEAIDDEEAILEDDDVGGEPRAQHGRTLRENALEKKRLGALPRGNRPQRASDKGVDE
jgi:hypothetical protein